ncbi:GNAT family N-acetyltransferase [Qipengyuania marisflavi]|uniref:N-acetyltransferase n=1 Tax=Qipengyuania marisflavi TaxID=2486356 RepID=A0A5S3P6M9_9SPHN|nr:N-acetyltransferase [Qipengyuania marisflavi]TMM48881.1 N-acetyltransferase [Qipengyuania marisflavi]
MATLVPLSAVDAPLIETLLDAAFGTGRLARTAYRIREGIAPLEPLSFAVLDDEEYLAGSIQVWPVALTDPDGRPHPMMMVGPVAVMPGRQGEGFGKALMAAALGAIDASAGDTAPLPQMMIGDPDYYGRWDFTAAHTAGWHCPGPFDPARLLVRCAQPAILPRAGMVGGWTEETTQALAK